MTLLLVILFISGYILIALEHQTGISKSAIALLLGILLWTFIPHTDNEIINHLGDTAEILRFKFRGIPEREEQPNAVRKVPGAEV